MTILARLTVKALPARVGSQGRESQMIEIITFYRIVDSTGEGQVKVHAQHNEKLGAYQSAKHYR